MTEIWNDESLVPPPINTYKCFDKSIDLPKLHTVLSDAVTILENQKILHREAAIISRLVYTMGRKFRHDIGHSYVRRTNVALLKYLNLEYIKDLNNYLSVVPENFYEDYVYVPTRQMLEFLLIRTQTLGKILFRINTCAKLAALFYFERLKRGDSAWLSLLPYSVLSRIWMLTKTLLKNVCKLYKGVFPYLNKFESVGAEIIPKNYEFPKDYASWINLNELDFKSDNIWKLSNTLLKITNNIEAMENVESNPEIELPSFISKMTIVDKKKEFKFDEDLGEKVSRSEFVKNNHGNNKIKKKEVKQILNKGSFLSESKSHEVKFIRDDSNNSKKPLNTHNVNNVQCLKSLKSFLKTEENLRLKNDKCSLSKDLGIIQWQSLKKIICKKMLKTSKKTPDISKEEFSKHFMNVWKINNMES